jgi:hypothetical protein
MTYTDSYDIYMSTTKVAAAFHVKQLAFTTADSIDTELTFADNAVPGIGKAGQAALEGEGISNAAQVVGWFLRVNGDRERFGEFLVENGCHASSVHRAEVGTVATVADKCSTFVLENADDAPVVLDVAAGTTQVAHNFAARQLSFADTLDSNPVPGLGAVGRERLLNSRYRITNAAQLVGHFMILNGDEQMFLDFLTGEGCGIQARHASTVLQAIRDKVPPFCSA